LEEAFRDANNVDARPSTTASGISALGYLAVGQVTFSVVFVGAAWPFATGSADPDSEVFMGGDDAGTAGFRCDWRNGSANMPTADPHGSHRALDWYHSRRSTRCFRQNSLAHDVRDLRHAYRQASKHPSGLCARALVRRPGQGAHWCNGQLLLDKYAACWRRCPLAENR
jgi:hypothetical protein